jgi:glycine cleavage system H protein
MTESALGEVSGFAIALDRRYEPATHMWVRLAGQGRARIGMDPLGIETSGTLAHLSLPEPGARLTAGRPFGQLEAVKFVGPLTSPVSGTVLAVNQAAAADPGLTERDPFGKGWLIEAALSDPGELDVLIADPDEVTAWYAARIEDYRLSGVIAR